MQVKKFEAKSMKEALELVKKHLGPEAIILSVKDNSRGFGLMGHQSVEVTAAVTDEILRRKRSAEAKLNQDLRQRYETAPAKLQKQFIEKAYRGPHPAPIKRPAGGMRYIDIPDEEGQVPLSAAGHSGGSPSRQRVKSAAHRALHVFNSAEMDKPVKTPAPPAAQVATAQSQSQIDDLKSEIIRLKNVIESFQKVPQSIIGLHPGADDGINYELSGHYQKLIRAGLNVENTVEILRKAQDTLPMENLKRSAFMDAWIAKHIMDHTVIAEGRTKDRIHVFVGPSGQGKSSSLVKLASHMAICEKKKIAIVTADTSKLGAPEQLRLFAQILNVPFAVIRQKSDWAEIEGQLLTAENILVDMPGVQLKSMGEVDKLRELMPPALGGRAIHYVQSVLAKDDAAFECAGRFQVLGFTDVIFTGLDEASQHGLIYNFQKKYKIPIHSFGVGPRIPEDFEPATKERIVDLIFKLSKLKREKHT